MTHRREEILAYWEDPSVESMYDKILLRQEIRLISAHIAPGSRVLDAGCGEAEATFEYAQIPAVSIVAADFSGTRLAKAAERLKGLSNVVQRQVDFEAPVSFGPVFDVVVSQRFLINLTDWDLQQQALQRLLGCLKPGGLLLMLEGSNDGVRELNELRRLLRLPPIDVQWHNVFFDDAALRAFMKASGATLVATQGLGAFFLLSRGIRPFFERGDLQWDVEFNRLASAPALDAHLRLQDRCSRLKLWVFRNE